MDDEQPGLTDTFSEDGVDIPECVDYVNLLYRLASTVFIIGMGSLHGHFNNPQDQIIA